MNYYFHGDTVDLTEEQRAILQSFWRGDMNRDSYEELASKLVSTSDSSYKNIVSVGIALHAPYSPEGMDDTPHDRGGKSKKAFMISEIAEDILFSAEDSNKKNETIRHWGDLVKLIDGRNE